MRCWGNGLGAGEGPGGPTRRHPVGRCSAGAGAPSAIPVCSSAGRGTVKQIVNGVSWWPPENLEFEEAVGDISQGAFGAFIPA